MFDCAKCRITLVSVAGTFCLDCQMACPVCGAAKKVPARMTCEKCWKEFWRRTGRVKRQLAPLMAVCPRCHQAVEVDERPTLSYHRHWMYAAARTALVGRVKFRKVLCPMSHVAVKMENA